MKQFAFATAVTLGLTAIATPAKAAILGWDVEYTGWWEEVGGGSISGMFSANEEDAADGVVSIDEMRTWMWNWSGNDTVPAFSISSGAGATTDFNPSFYVDGTPNVPSLFELDDLDQGVFISASGEEVIDLEALLVIANAGSLDDLVIEGNPTASQGSVFISEPEMIPEPATVLGLLALAGISAATFQQRQQEA